MTSLTLNLSSRKAQFFILTTVVIVGVFYTLSKYINPYAFVDTSEAAVGGEAFFFDNVKEKAIKTLEISDSTELNDNLLEYANFVGDMASEKGYNLVFNYTVEEDSVDISMVLMSQRYTLKANFTCYKVQYTKVYDFKGITYPSSTHKMWDGTAYTEELPSPTAEGHGEVSTDCYLAVSEPNGVCSNLAGGVGINREWHKFLFIVDEPSSTINDLTAFWRGAVSYGIGSPCDYTEIYSSALYIWNFNTVSWELVDSHSSSSIQYIVKSFTSNIDDYINSEGYMYLIATTLVSDPKCSGISSDFVKLEVDSTQLIQWVCT